MLSKTSFRELNIKDDFDSFFDEIYCEWDKAWLRKKEYIGTQYYAIKGNLQVWKEYYTNSTITLLIFQTTEKKIGYIGYQLEGDTLILTELMIKESERGNNFGAKLLAQFFEMMKIEKRIFSTYQLETHDSNLSNKIYLKAGFTVKEIILKDRENDENTIVYVKHNF